MKMPCICKRIMIGCVWILSFSPIKGGAVPEAKKEVARPDPFLQRVQIIQQMDAEGLSEYQSERDSELNKMKLTPETDRTSTSMPVKIDEDLSHLSQPQEITTATDGTLLADKAIRDKLMLERIIPVWSGTNWINGNNLANNGFVVTKKIEDLLASLNYFDAMSRHFSGPDGDMLGEYRGKVKIIRNHLLYLDYIVKYDKTFDIWRITGTNTPAAHTP